MQKQTRTPATVRNAKAACGNGTPEAAGPITHEDQTRMKAHKTASLLFVFILAACLASEARATSDSHGQLLSMIDQMEASYAKLSDYTATFQKQERVGQKLNDQEQIFVKFAKPFKVYMKWLETSPKEALYVHGEYGGKVLAHCPGILGLWTWTFHPTDARLMDGNRHPITEIGFEFIIKMMRENIPMAMQHGEMQLISIRDETYDGKPVTRIEAKFNPKDGRKYYTSHMILHVDKEHMMPIGVTCYDDKGNLEEQYGYKDLKVNVGLTSLDFSKANKNYKF